jgi:hypothetical protein
MADAQKTVAKSDSKNSEIDHINLWRRFYVVLFFGYLTSRPLLVQGDRSRRLAIDCYDDT